LQSEDAVERRGECKFKKGECERKNLYRKKEGNKYKRKTIKIKEYIVLGYDSVV
jgi:hypothetical protein